MLNFNAPVINYQLVQISATASQTRYYFPDLPNLRDVKTYKITAFHQLLIQKDINGVNLISQSDFENSYITLYSNGFEYIQKLGLSALQTVSRENNFKNMNGGMALQPLNIDFSKSYVECAPSITPTFPCSFVFGIYYAK